MVFFLFAFGNVVSAGCARPDSPCPAAASLELVYGSVLGACWILWNMWFTVRMYSLQQMQEELAEKEDAPLFMNKRRSSFKKADDDSFKPSSPWRNKFETFRSRLSDMTALTRGRSSAGPVPAIQVR